MASARSVADAFSNNFLSKYDIPVTFVRNHGHCFVYNIFKATCVKMEISHIFTVPYRAQWNMTEGVNRTLIQMILFYIGLHHTNCDCFLQQFYYALRMTMHESKGKFSGKFFLGRKIITPFQKVNMLSNSEKKFY